MKCAKLWLWAMVLMAAGLSSCSLDHARTGNGNVTSPPNETGAEWTILYYGAGNYAGDQLPDGQSETVATVHGLQDTYGSEQVHAVALVTTTTDSGQCRFYDIQFRPGEAGNQISSVGRNWGSQDMSSPQVLKQFVDSSITLYPARHYALIIGGKGEAWRGACRDDRNGGRVMPMPAMSQSLDQSSQNGLPVHFDVLLWLMPGMNSLEVAYEICAKADYMVATSSVLPQAGFLATDKWLLDLNANPAMSADSLGRFMVVRMSEEAQSAHDTLATFNLMDLRSMRTLALDVSQMADSMRSVLQGRTPRLLQIWHSLTDIQTGDSAAIDLPAFVDAIRADSIFSSVSGVRQSADLVHADMDQVLIYRQSTRQGILRKGLAIYAPDSLSSADSTSYSELRMSRDQPGWDSLLVAMHESGTSLVQVRGVVRWNGHNLRDSFHPLYVFLNTAQTGAPVVTLTALATLTDTTRQDSVAFRASFALDGDSTSAYLGVFQDLNPDQQLSTGDRYGYFHRNATPPRDWLTIHSGDLMDSVFVTLTTTR